MQRLRGWLLDVYIEGSRAILWIKSESGETIRLTDKYQPDFYIKLSNHSEAKHLFTTLSNHPNIMRIELAKKCTSLSMNPSDVAHVHVDSVQNFQKVLSDLASVHGIEAYYNVDLLHVQWYLFRKGIPPTTRVSVTYSEKNELAHLRMIDDRSEIRPPPFTSILFDITVSSENLSPDANADPLSLIQIYDENQTLVETFDGSEKDLLQAFEKFIKAKDPDLLVANSEETLAYILKRALILGLNIQLGRETVNISQLRRLLPYCHKGRIFIDLHAYLSLGIAGIVERSRFTMAPLSLAAKWPAGRIVDSRQCYEALKKGILIPRSHNFYRYARTAWDTIFSDRGGLILSPEVGLHENVGLLDFESMFPHIIIKHNVSYETATPETIRTDREGFLTELTKVCLKRRLHFKHLRNKLSEDDPEKFWCEQRQTALKGILVVIYGYSGCFANRFSNVACYEQINLLARRTLVKSMNIALEKGFEVIYADSDSLFIKKKDADKGDFEAVAQAISHETGLPITLDKHFQFLVLLRQESDPNLEATRRYFGKLTNNELYYRGIELRRHDYPVFLKEFETRLMETLFDAESPGEIWRTQYKKAFSHVVETCDLIRTGKVPPDELVITKNLGKPVDTYRSLMPHVVAAFQIMEKGKRLREREGIDFLYVNAGHRNPFRRVVAAALSKEGNRQYYDREKYVELAQGVAETVLGVFGFDRRQLGVGKKPKDYIEELKLEGGNEVVSELGTSGGL